MISCRSKGEQAGKRMLPGSCAALFVAVLFAATFHKSLLAHEVHDEVHQNKGSTGEHQGSPVDRLIYDAIDAQSRHDFSTALELTHDALEIRNDNDQAWLLLASIHLVRGETHDATAACRQLSAVSPLVMLTCHARVATARSDFAAIKPKLESLLAVMDLTWVSPETLAWSLSAAGDLAVAAGEPDEGIRYFTESLEIAENLQVRAALADVLIDCHQFDAAKDVIDHGTPSVSLAVRRLIVRERQGLLDKDRVEIEALDHKFQVWISENNWLHAREMARFYLDVVHLPALARELALVNVTVQREPEDLLLAARTEVPSGGPPLIIPAQIPSARQSVD